MPIGDEWSTFGIFDRRTPEERSDQALDETFGAGYAESARVERESRHEVERQRVIDYVSAQLRARLNTIIGSPMNPNTMDLIQREVQDAMNGLRSQGIQDVNVQVRQNPADRNGLVIEVSHQGLERRNFVNNSFGENIAFSGQAVARTIRARTDVQRAVDEAMEGLSSEERRSLARQMEVGRTGVQSREDEAEVYGRVMAEAYARRLQELGFSSAPSELAPRPSEEKDTTSNLTPRRKLEID